MAFITIHAELENRTKYTLTRSTYELEDNASAASPNSIGPTQSTFWYSKAETVVDLGTEIRMDFAINDPDDAHFVAYLYTKCTVPLVGKNTYRMSVDSAGEVTAHNGGMNTSVRFVLEGTEGAFVARIFPQGAAECIEIAERVGDVGDVARAVLRDLGILAARDRPPVSPRCARPSGTG